jgi:hypothetical protein
MLISLLIILIIFGAVLYVIPLLPIDATVKTIIKVIAIVFLVIWLLQKFAPALNGALG